MMTMSTYCTESVNVSSGYPDGGVGAS